MAVTYKDIDLLSNKSTLSGSEKIPVSDTQYVTTNQVAGLAGASGKADKVSSATNGDFAGLDSNGNLTDSGKKWSDFILRADIYGEDAAKCAAFYDGANDNSFALPGSDVASDCDYILEVANNKVSSWSSTTDNTNYPSEKLVKDSLDAKQATLVSGTNIKTINNESILGSGNITVGGGGSTTDCVHKTGDETIAGDKTFTDDIIVGDASNIKYGASSGSGFTRGYAVVNTLTSSNTITFTGLSGEPKAFVIADSYYALPGASTAAVLGIVGDSTGYHGVYTTGTQHNYSSGFTASYSNGSLTVTAPTGVVFCADAWYGITYYYGDGTLTFKTSQIQPGSGVTAVTFTGNGLTEVPAMYACFLETAVNSESYRRVALYTNSLAEYDADEITSEGLTFYSSQIANTTSSFTVSYNNGLVINSGGVNAGGYFHNPGTYTLYYLMASDIGGGGGGSYADLSAELSAMNTSISAKEATSNKVTSVSAQSTDTQYPSAKLLYDQLALKQGTITVSTSEPTSYQGNNGDIWFVVSS